MVDDVSTGRWKNLAQHENDPALELVEGDIADLAVAARAVDGADRVFHVAALADIVPSIERPHDYFHANVDGTFSLIEAARAGGVRRIIYTASSSCYGIPDAYPTPESAPIRPQYPYALTKRLGEELVLHWGQVYGMDVVSLRLFNVYGPRARTSGTYGAVFGVFLAQLLAGEPLTVVGDGTQVRDFTFVTDVVRAFVLAAERGRPGEVYNVGTGAPSSVNRLVELLGATEVVNIPKRPGEPDSTEADATKIRADLGWEPQVSFEEGVRIMLEHIEHWRDAPVWTAGSIADATATWFRHLHAKQPS